MSLTKKTVCGLVVALMLLPASASAKTRVAVGLGDQHASTFSSSAFRALQVKKARYFIRWDAAKHASALAAADDYVRAANAAGVKVLLHFSTNNFAHGRAKLPSVKQYKKYVGKLVKRYRGLGVREFGVWNEANHNSQPTYKNPRRAASFFRTLKTMCKGCTIVALDVLDQRGVEGYIARWFSGLPRSYRSKPLIIGIHNYSDTNRLRSSGTSRIIRTARSNNRRAQFWLTETGGIVNFGRAWPCNEKRAASRVAYMFKLAKQFRRTVKRLYAFSWTGNNCQGFDSGLVRQDGSTRPAYKTFRAKSRSFTR
ncbi:MAG: hypothetical protein QOF12_320 [Solirubrobacteraceae bacterium]|jgi:hypothetical protein|nr:hypothetical protein [Solirubrobacteraceae bacterium]